MPMLTATPPCTSGSLYNAMACTCLVIIIVLLKRPNKVDLQFIVFLRKSWATGYSSSAAVSLYKKYSTRGHVET